MPADWQVLFNGKDLSGWRSPTVPDAFAVVDGAIRCRPPGKLGAHLFHVGDAADGFVRYTDFELEATVRADPSANSGILFHCDFETVPGRPRLARGHEVQLNTSAADPAKTGSLYAVVNKDRSAVDEAKWFTVRLTVAGKRITISLDGVVAVDYTEPADVTPPKDRPGRKLSPTGGAIALQAHTGEGAWFFRDIRVRVS
jgi:hypothetical protein